MMDISLSTIIAIQVVTFLVLVLLLRRLLYSAYAAELKRLRELNLENQNKAEKLGREMEKTEHEHQGGGWIEILLPGGLADLPAGIDE